jgi:hypothetical protein
MLLENVAPYITPQGDKICNQESSTANKLTLVLHCGSPIIRCSQVGREMIRNG